MLSPLLAFDDVPPFFVGIFGVVTLVVNIFFAVGVARDLSRLRDDGARIWFVPKAIWIIATLVGGLLTAAVYWLLHHSTLARHKDR